MKAYPVLNGTLFLFYFIFIVTGFLLSIAALKFSLSFFQVHDWFTDPHSTKHPTISRVAPSFLQTLQKYEELYSQYFFVFIVIGFGIFFLIHLAIHYFRRREFRNYLLMGESIPSLSIQLVVEQVMLLVLGTVLCFGLFSLFAQPLMASLSEWERSLLQSTDFFSELKPVEEPTPPNNVLSSVPFTPRTIHSAYVHKEVGPEFVSFVQRRLAGQVFAGTLVLGISSAFFHSVLLKYKSNRMHQ